MRMGLTFGFHTGIRLLCPQRMLERDPHTDASKSPKASVDVHVPQKKSPLSNEGELFHRPAHMPIQSFQHNVVNTTSCAPVDPTDILSIPGQPLISVPYLPAVSRYIDRHFNETGETSVSPRGSERVGRPRRRAGTPTRTHLSCHGRRCRL